MVAWSHAYLGTTLVAHIVSTLCTMSLVSYNVSLIGFLLSTFLTCFSFIHLVSVDKEISSFLVRLFDYALTSIPFILLLNEQLNIFVRLSSFLVLTKSPDRPWNTSTRNDSSCKHFVCESHKFVGPVSPTCGSMLQKGADFDRIKDSCGIVVYRSEFTVTASPVFEDIGAVATREFKLCATSRRANISNTTTAMVSLFLCGKWPNPQYATFLIPIVSNF